MIEKNDVFKADTTELNLADLRQAIYEGRSDEAADILVKFFNVILNYDDLDKEEEFQHIIDIFIEFYISAMSEKEFNPSRHFKEYFLKISFMVACFMNYRSGDNFDSVLHQLIKNNSPLYKVLSFYSIYNSVNLPFDKISQQANEIFSIWFFSYLCSYEDVLTSRYFSQKYNTIFLNLPDLSFVSEDAHILYFLISYYDTQNEKIFKEWLNKTVKKCSPLSSLPRKEELKPRQRRKIAICSQNWFPRHSVYRSQFLYLESLAEIYDLYLICKDYNNLESIENIFKGSIEFSLENWQEGAHAILEHDFDMIYFPDIGLNLESIFLANARFAPIQLSSYGHPASTWGAEIDYWIGGQLAENLEKCSGQYSERLVLLPGLGAIPSFPAYACQNPEEEDNCIYINCLWGGAKYNSRLLACLQEIIRRTTRKVCFRFFPGGTIKKCKIFILRKHLQEKLGEDNVCVYSQLDYYNYMKILEQSHFSIDSYPFGGYNTIIDSLHCSAPVVAWEGNNFRNRAASAVLRLLSMEDLIADSQESYVNLILHMIEDKSFLNKQRNKVRHCNYLSVLRDIDKPKDFVKAMRYIFDKHDVLKLDTHKNPIFWDAIKSESVMT